MSNSDWKIPLLAIALSDEAIAVFKNFPDTVENQAQPSFGEIKCDCPGSDTNTLDVTPAISAVPSLMVEQQILVVLMPLCDVLPPLTA